MAPKHVEIAEKCRAIIGHMHTGERLPPLTELARRLGAARVTVWKAVHILSDEGIVSVRRGRPSVITQGGMGAETGTGNRLTRAEYRLYHKLKTRIQKGVYHAGSVLPKIAYFTISGHLSRNTVTAALGLLAKESLIHKRGGRWIIGPKTDTSSGSAPVMINADSPVICIMGASNMVFWNNLQSNMSIAPFFHSFESEIERYGITHSLLCNGVQEVDSVFPAGKEGIRRHITRLGKRYRGTLIVPWSTGADTMPPAAEWCRWLLRFGRPVVAFNAFLASTLSGAEIRSIQRERRPAWGRFFCCSMNEPQAVALAVQTLYSAGHRRIAIPFPHGRWSSHWIRNRIARIHNEASRSTPPIRVFVWDFDNESSFFSHHPWWHIPNKIITDTVRRSSGGPHPGSEGEFLPALPIREFQPFLGLISKEHVTAVIMPNDRYGIQFFSLFKEMHVDIPEDLSVLSFDNNREVRLFPLSSIDFGCGQVGYRAAHVFIGDIRAHADDARGNIIAVPHLVDRGTLGPAPRSGNR